MLGVSNGVMIVLNLLYITGWKHLLKKQKVIKECLVYRVLFPVIWPENQTFHLNYSYILLQCHIHLYLYLMNYI